MTPEHRSYLAAVVENLRQLPHLHPDPFHQVKPYAQAAMTLAVLDLEPAREDLKPCYCPRNGGKPPRDPVDMLRSLVLMSAVGSTAVNAWAKRLKREPVLAVLAGFEPGDTPGVGTYYDFFHRLLDGPWKPRCQHTRRPSDAFRGKKGRYRRNLIKEREETKAASQADLAEANETKVQNLVKKAQQTLDQALPKDCLNRIENILFKCAVVPSVEMGLLGHLGALDVAGDGTTLPSNASGNGKLLCKCREQGEYRCKCYRSISDPDGNWGYDSYRKVYYFGYRLHALVAKHGEVELPLHLMIEAANTPDVVMGVEAATRLWKLMRTFLPSASINYAIFDKGYDAIAFHRLILELGAKPIISLIERNFKPGDAQGIKRDEQGRPLCPGGQPMRMHTYNKRKKTVVFNCPVKRPGRRNRKLYIKAHPEECPLGRLCEPESKMGPLVYLRAEDDPRLNPVVPRGSDEYKRASAMRTCTERFNSFSKEAGGMGDSPYRHRHIFLLMILCQALRRHAMVWVAQQFGTSEPKSLDELLGMLEGLAQDRQPEAEAA